MDQSEFNSDVQVRLSCNAYLLESFINESINEATMQEMQGGGAMAAERVATQQVDSGQVREQVTQHQGLGHSPLH